MSVIDILYIIVLLILFFTVTIIIFYSLLGVVSIREGIYYFKKNSFTRYREILTSPLAPSVTLIAPAYNEDKNIVESVRSFLSLNYPNFSIIIVNDGSTDDTLKKLIQAYDLVPGKPPVKGQLNTKEVKAIYNSTKKSFKSLTVIDKENGGKGDALNAGVNFSTDDYVVNIDVDCILEPDSLLKLVKPFLEESKREVIAVGGVIRIANNCIIEDGKITDVIVPTDLLSRFQVLEYIRAFLLGRMAWSRLNGLLIISGAMGMFKKEILIKSGGYDIHTVGEDMEIVVRMRKYMIDEERKYSVKYIPDPLCWTECPKSVSALVKQRNRWTRGMIETLTKHKKMTLKPKYGLLGMISMPFWIIYEWIGPILEVIGVVIFILFIVLGIINWTFFLWIAAAAYAFTFAYSLLSLVIEELTYRQYTKRGDFWRLMLVALLEPLIFHPLNLYASLKGNLLYLRGDHKWGKMKRTKFGEE